MENSTYQDILKSTLSDRCRKNGRYSLRAFARDLGISPQRLSHVLNGRHGLSPEAAVEMANNLGMDEGDKELFCALVGEKHARTSAQKNKAKEKVRELSSAYKDLSLDHFKLLADWYHFAILELTQVEDFVSDINWIAETLGITQIETSIAIERLIKLDLLECNSIGQYNLTGHVYVDPKGTPSQALRQFHRQLMEKASLAMDFQKLDERDMSSMILTVDEADIPRAKEEIKKFRTKFDADFSKGQKKTSLYCLGIQFFNLRTK